MADHIKLKLAMNCFSFWIIDFQLQPLLIDKRKVWQSTATSEKQWINLLRYPTRMVPPSLQILFQWRSKLKTKFESKLRQQSMVNWKKPNVSTILNINFFFSENRFDSNLLLFQLTEVILSYDENAILHLTTTSHQLIRKH